MIKQFQIFYHFISWTEISLGVNIDFRMPNIQIHTLFGFIGIGWHERPEKQKFLKFSSYKRTMKKNAESVKRWKKDNNFKSYEKTRTSSNN